MKAYLLLYTLLTLLLPSYVFAQGDREDVIYLKNGSTYRGTIIEQIPNVSYKIEIAGGSVIVVKADDVTRITKEEKAYPTDVKDSGRRYVKRRTLPPYGYKEKGGFFEIQFAGQYAGAGFRALGGYKINQFAFVGVSIGVYGIAASANHLNTSTSYGGAYFPFLVYYSGDILKRKITPYYAVGVGYSAVSTVDAGPDGGDYIAEQPYVYIHGGPAGSLDFGARMYLGRRFTMTVSASLDIQYARSETYTWYGYAQYTDTYTSMVMLLPGLRIGLGLVK